MKKLIVIFALIIIGRYSQGQSLNLPVDSATQKISYNEVVNIPGASKDLLYARAKEWFAKTFRSGGDVIQMDDKLSGKLIGNGTGSESFKFGLVAIEFWLKYNLSITVKDDKYRYELTNIDINDKYAEGYKVSLDDIVIRGIAGSEKTKDKNGDHKKRFDGYASKSDSYIKSLMADLKKTMATKSKDDF